MNDPSLFAGCIAVFFLFGAVLFYYGTGLFGLTALCVFHVAASTLSVLFFGYALDEIPNTVTPEHEDVWIYSLWGLAAMILGIYLGLRPLKAHRHSISPGILAAGWPAHINEQMGWLSFCVGLLAQLALRAVGEIPTLSTAVNCLAALARIGILILLVSAMATGRWKRFAMAAGIFAAVSVSGSFDSGHTFIRIDTALPLIVIYIASSGMSLKFIVQGVLGFAAMVPMVSAWMNSREIIRSGYLQGLSLWEKGDVFFGEFFRNLHLPTAESFIDLLVTRVDMTEGLAAQVRHQPDLEPYAYGETFYSAFYTLIPRAIWPDKPIVAGGSEFYTRFTGEIRSADDLTSIGIAYPFELYANGGPILVVVGLGVIGFLCARLELKLLSAPKSLGTFWALALATAVISDGGQRTDVVLPALVAAALAAYAMGHFVEVVGSRLGIASSTSPRGARALPASERRG